MIHGRKAIRVGEVHVWLARVPVLGGAGDLRRCQELLTPEDLARSERFRVPEHRHRSLVGRALTRFALSRYCEVSPRAWRFSTSRRGRPGIPRALAKGLTFNLSSSPGLVTCAIARAPGLGIDVEAIDRSMPLDLIDRLFTPSEAEDIRSQPPERQPERFVDFWTLKEAYLKGRGLGLEGPPRRLGFRLGGRIELFPESRTVAGEGAWHFCLWSPTSTHRAALAVRERLGVPVRVVSHWWHGGSGSVGRQFAPIAFDSCAD